MEFLESLGRRIAEAPDLEAAANELRMLLVRQVDVDAKPGDRVLVRKHLVDTYDGLSIYVYANDHLPPHFHIRSAGLNVRFRLSDCSPLSGDEEMGRSDLRRVRWWFENGGREQLQATWARTRPG